MLKFGNQQSKLLERLCNEVGVSGDEGAVRKLVLDEIQPYADEVKVDALGNVLATKKGNKRNRLKVMLAAHMDEIGFMLTYDDGKGIFRFGLVGGIDERQLVGKPVWVGKDKIQGVIGAKPIHLTTANERKNAIPLDSLRIDVGEKNGSKVKVGDRATFATEYRRLGPSVRAKALDDRLGVATLVELLKNAPANIDLLAAFTVQEEVGLRGARVAAFAFDPDLALVLDCTPAYDLPSWDDEENTRYNTRLDHGPALYVSDGATLSDPRLIRHFVEIAQTEGIPYQIRQPGGGGTDAGAIHKQRAGIPSLSISVPGRYLHTAASIIRINDWKYTLNLVHAALSNLKPGILKTDR
jgi:tetrahedral aminopeptidase